MVVAAAAAAAAGPPLDGADGAVVLRAVGREVRRERGLRRRADGRVLPPPQRPLAHGRLEHLAVSAAAAPGPLRPVLSDLLDAPPQVRLPAALAVQDDAASDDSEQDDEPADDDAGDGAGVQRPGDPGRRERRRRCRVGDVDDVGGEDVALQGEGGWRLDSQPAGTIQDRYVCGKLVRARVKPKKKLGGEIYNCLDSVRWQGLSSRDTCREGSPSIYRSRRMSSCWTRGCRIVWPP